MMQARAIDVSSLEKTAEDLRGEGATAIFVAIDGKPSGVLAIADPIKPTTADAIRSLRDVGVRVIILTRDNRTTADAVAQKASRTSRPKFYAKIRARSSSGCAKRDASWRWPATA